MRSARHCILALLVCTPGAVSAQEAGQLGEALQRMEMALLRNIPPTVSCTVEVAMTRPDGRGAFAETARLRPLRLEWKGPATLTLGFVGTAPAPPAPAQEDFSTTACRGPYFDMHMERVFGALQKVNRLNERAPVPLGPLQLFLMTLRADATAKMTGRTTVGGQAALGMDFPNAGIALPIGFVAKRVQIWIGEKDGPSTSLGAALSMSKGGLPVRMRLFTQRQGILTFDIAYAARKDAHGIEYLLPDMITLQPAVEEEGPSAAFPMRVHFRDYRINEEAPGQRPW